MMKILFESPFSLKRQALRLLLTCACVGLLPGTRAVLGAEMPPRVTSIDFKGLSDPSEIDITVEGAVTAEKQVNPADKQVIINIPGATLAGAARRSIDTSSFNGNVSLISSYQSSTSHPGAKVVIQLRDNVDVKFSQDGELIRLLIPKSVEHSAGALESPNSVADGGDAATKSSKDSPAPNAKRDDNDTPMAQDDLDKALQGLKTKHFTGRPITLQMRDIDVRDAFNIIAETSGFNIILSPDVQKLAPVTLSLVDVPWDQALDVLMQTLRLGADRKGNIMRILTLENLAKEMELDQKLKLAEEAVEPRKTEIFPISYANLSDLAKTISSLLGIEIAGVKEAGAQARAMTALGGANAAPATNGAPAGAGATSTSVPSSSQVSGASSNVANANVANADLKVLSDERTNSLIVWGTGDVIERVKKLIAVLDTQTPQVIIEGKVVEAEDTFTTSLGGNLGLGNAGSGTFAQYGISSLGNNFGAGLYSSASTLGSSIASSATSTGGTIAAQIIPLGQTINAVLNVAEAQSKIKVIASPRAVVLNKQRASISQSTPVLTPQSSQSALSSSVVQTNQITNAQINLNVTPTVTSDGGVLLDLSLERDLPTSLANLGGSAGQSAVETRTINTRVLVDSGSTLVLGGFSTVSDSKNFSGIPFLRELPVIGWLFGSEGKENDHDEIFFFITPQILNPKKSGLQKS